VLESGVLLGLFPLALRGMVMIMTVGVAALSECSFIEGFPCFRSFNPGDGLSWITLYNFMVMSHIAASVSVSTCIALVGSSPNTVGSVTPQCHLGFLLRTDSKPLSHVNQTKERTS
jgi:hypothetical protein